MRLKVVLTKGRRATEVGFSGVVAALFGGPRARPIPQEFKFITIVLVMNLNS
jgi:hypothetical protein